MRPKATFLLGAAVGYVLGTRAGRERHEQIRRAVRRVWDHPTVRRRVGAVTERRQPASRGMTPTYETVGLPGTHPQAGGNGRVD